jgi:hypothetical protein
MTYMSELRAALVDAAHRQHAAAEPAGRERASRRARWRRSTHDGRALHSGRAILASVLLGLAGTAVGPIQVGAPLGPEPQPSGAVAKPVGAPVGAPTSVRPRP